MKERKRPPLLLREEFEGLFLKLTDEEKGKLLSALMLYQWHGVEPNSLRDKLMGVFIVLQSLIDNDVLKYYEACQKNKQNASKRYNMQRNDEYEDI